MITTEESWTSWLCDLEAEDCYPLDHSETKGVDGNFPSRDEIAPSSLENLQQSFSTNNKRSYSTFKTENSSTTMSNNFSGDDNNFDERPCKKITTTSNSAQSYILSFDNVNPAPILNNVGSSLKPKGKVVNHGKSLKKEKLSTRNVQGNMKCGSLVRSPQHVQDHIMAERKRREKISQQFIALSALIPGLKKMDKATVLGDAIKHVKQLQEQVKQLEEEQSKRKSVEPVIFIEKSKCSAEEDISDTSSNSGDGNSYDPSKTKSLPEVEARVSEKSVLIRIHCHKQKGIFTNILTKIENLHLSVINSSVLPFGASILDITIVAEMDDEFSLSAKELARNVRVGLMKLMEL